MSPQQTVLKFSESTDWNTARNDAVPAVDLISFSLETVSNITKSIRFLAQLKDRQPKAVLIKSKRRQNNTYIAKLIRCLNSLGYVCDILANNQPPSCLFIVGFRKWLHGTAPKGQISDPRPKGLWRFLLRADPKLQMQAPPLPQRSEAVSATWIINNYIQPVLSFSARPVEAAHKPRIRVLSNPSAAQLSPYFHSTAVDSVLTVGDSRKVLTQIPSSVFQTCITSPPYWSLRNYNTNGQIGLEASVYEYIKNLTAVLEEVRRVLRDDGTLWLNIGDSYTSGGRACRAPDKKNPIRAMDIRPPTPDGLKSKDLIGVPWRLAFALQSAGWYLRADLIWHKPNCQPESVKDRPTRSHEYVFLFSKSEKYVYNYDAVRGPNNRNLRTVLEINTQAYKEAHFATFPPRLVEPCVKLGSQANDLILDPFIGAGTTGLVARALNRRFFGIELNPEYVSIAERRLNGT